jgi:dihydrofolate reductase
VDGFIARDDGDVKWLEGAAEGSGDYGFHAFFAKIDALVMGRATFDKMMGFDRWFYGDKPVVVLTHRPAPMDVPSTVAFMEGAPREIVERLAARGWHRLYVDGGKTIQSFLAAGLVDDLIVSQVPVLIGRGIPLFGPLPHDVRLDLVSTRSFPGGMVQNHYRTAKTATHGPRTR